MATYPIHVVDLSHYQTVDSFDDMKKAGVVGVILKVSEGLTVVDDKYLMFQKAAEEAGLLVGGYHFLHAGDPIPQAKFFLKLANWGPNTLLAADWEDPPHGAAMSLEDVKTFLEYIYQVTGQRPAVYSGNVAKQKIGDAKDEYMAQHRYWLASYTANIVLQASWDKYWLLQFTGDNLGPNLPRRCPGVQGGGLDLNTGVPAEIEQLWTGGRPNKANTGVLPDGDVADKPTIGLDDLGVGAIGVSAIASADWITGICVAAILVGIFVWWKYFRKPTATTPAA